MPSRVGVRTTASCLRRFNDRGATVLHEVGYFAKNDIRLIHIEPGSYRIASFEGTAKPPDERMIAAAASLSMKARNRTVAGDGVCGSIK
jgi:hypothetical protein